MQGKLNLSGDVGVALAAGAAFTELGKGASALHVLTAAEYGEKPHAPAL